MYLDELRCLGRALNIRDLQRLFHCRLPAKARRLRGKVQVTFRDALYHFRSLKRLVRAAGRQVTGEECAFWASGGVDNVLIKGFASVHETLSFLAAVSGDCE